MWNISSGSVVVIGSNCVQLRGVAMQLEFPVAETPNDVLSDQRQSNEQQQQQREPASDPRSSDYRYPNDFCDGRTRGEAHQDGNGRVYPKVSPDSIGAKSQGCQGVKASQENDD
jgi:hypothetical protein